MFVIFKKASDKVRHKKLGGILQTKSHRQPRFKNNIQLLLASECTNNSNQRIQIVEYKENKGKIINAKTINNIRFAEDTIKMGSSAEELQELLNTNSLCE